MSGMMDAYIVERETGASGLKLTELQRPVPQAGEVLIRVRASSLNFRDHLTTSAQYGPGHTMTGRIPVSDGAGEIVELGAGVSAFKRGDRVAANFFPTWISGAATSDQLRAALGGAFAPGMLAEYVALPAASLIALPPSLSFAEAATLPCAGVTAWYALFETFKLLPGQTVVVQGTGGVSIFALQLAKMAGAKVIVTSSSDAKLEHAKTLGADHGVNYTTHPDWDKEVKELTHGHGSDIIVEVGGAGTIEKSLSTLASGGGIAVIGILSGLQSHLSLFQVLAKQAHLHGVYVGAREHLDALARALSANAIKPVIDKVFTFAEAKDAFAYQTTNKHFGKIVIDHNMPDRPLR
jgi:NADPH:quinone reductase-like Zn-dependent oxidoreductase